MAITEAFDTFEIVIGEAAPIVDDRREPVLMETPFLVEFDEPARLDPKRIGLTWELPPAVTREMPLRSPLVSLAIHLLPLLAIIGWPTAAAEIPPSVPVELVFEEPPPQPAPQPLPQMESGRLASVDMGDIKQKDLGATTSEAPPAAGESQPNQSQPQTATTAAPPMPVPKPAPPKPQPAAIHLPKPSGAPVPQQNQTPHEAPHASRYAGPTAVRDDYLAYLVTLTRQHIDLLPMSVIGDRRGETVISVVVHGDGAIGPLAVLRSSGYPDIDHRIEDMVAAVRKFPPLPQWYQGNAVQLELSLRFPDAIEKP